MTETPTGRRASGRGRRARERFRRRLSETPRWAKRVSTFIVTTAAVVGAVATIIALVKPSPPPPVLGVELGQPEWAAHDLTLGSYLAWQQRESDTLGLRPGGESAAAALDGSATHTDARQIVLNLARYTALRSGASAQSGASHSTAGSLARGATMTTEENEADAGGTSTAPGSTPSTPNSDGETNGAPPSTAPNVNSNSSEPPTGTQSTSGSKATGALSSGVLREAQSRLGNVDKSRLEQKASEQEAIIKEAGAGSGPTLMKACQGIGYGGCSPEAGSDESSTSPPTGTTSPYTSSSPPPSGASEQEERAAKESSTAGAPRPPSLGQHQRELLEIAEGARLGSPTNASLIPSLMTAGLSDSERARVAAVLGDAVSFNVHTHGWIGQQLWLTWTMYEKHDGYWNPSSQVYLIDHAEAYLVPSAAEDEGVLTFWFPIPKQRGDYQVHYFIRAPGSGKKLAAGKSKSFRS